MFFWICALSIMFLGHTVVNNNSEFYSIMQFQKISILPPPPPQKGLEFPRGVGSSVRPKNSKKCMKLNWNFKRGGGWRLRKKSLPWGRYGYFLELHILIIVPLIYGTVVSCLTCFFIVRCMV